jgi:hypothetical protein
MSSTNDRNKISNRSAASDAHLRVEVLAFKPHVKNTMKGWLDLALPAVGLKLLGCTLHEKNGSRWIGLPAREYQDNGVRRWAPIVDTLSKEAREALQKAALAALDAHESVERTNNI